MVLVLHQHRLIVIVLVLTAIAVQPTAVLTQIVLILITLLMVHGAVAVHQQPVRVPLAVVLVVLRQHVVPVMMAIAVQLTAVLTQIVLILITLLMVHGAVAVHQQHAQVILVAERVLAVRHLVNLVPLTHKLVAVAVFVPVKGLARRMEAAMELVQVKTHLVPARLLPMPALLRELKLIVMDPVHVPTLRL